MLGLMMLSRLAMLVFPARSLPDEDEYIYIPERFGGAIRSEGGLYYVYSEIHPAERPAHALYNPDEPDNRIFADVVATLDNQQQAHDRLNAQLRIAPVRVVFSLGSAAAREVSNG